jgi:DNA adenine methylase
MEIKTPDNKSPLRYPGGKTRACKIIEELLVSNLHMSTFTNLVSPFFGGGSFEFYMASKYNLFIHANDKFTPLINFWKHAQTSNDNLIETINALRPVTKDKFIAMRSNIFNSNVLPLDRAAYYFAINRCSFSGATLSGGYSLESSTKRFTDNSITNVSELNLKRVNFTNDDFSDFLTSTNLSKSLIFADPPYYLKKSNLYGDNGDLHEHFDHQKLYNTLRSLKKWVLCYNNTEYIKDLYQDYEIFDVNWSYGMNQSKESSEIIIISQ